MKISKAIVLANKEGRGIARRSQFPRPVWFIPTNTTTGMIVVTNKDDLTPRWEPKIGDLTADDWVVYG